jgi:hypothetical protein
MLFYLLERLSGLTAKALFGSIISVRRIRFLVTAGSSLWSFVPGQGDPAFILILHNERVQIVLLLLFIKNLYCYVRIAASLLQVYC